MRIGQVARETGVTASALRYYEKEGLLPAPARIANRRDYDPLVIGRIRIIQVARDSGFSIAETRTFVSNYTSDSVPSARWRAMADRKIEELDAVIAQASEMKRLLQTSFNCNCASLKDCETLIVRRRKKPAKN